MDFFDALTLLGGLSLFLFGMSVMGSSLEKRAGGSLKALLGKLTTNKMAGFLTGLGVTAVIQSSSATTVMVVGFVNSGLMSLRQAINVIMGANVGTTVTAWLLGLTGIESSNFYVRLLKPSSFTPVLAAIGIVLYLAGKTGRKKDAGMILLGFATLMFGMETMSEAVSGLKNVPEFANLLLIFNDPLLGVLAGTLLTAIIQSSSASVGILQALAVTGQITYGIAVPIVMGQNIGTCVTAMLSSIGTSKNARRAAVAHLCFNVIGTAVWLSVFCIARALLPMDFIDEIAGPFGIAVAHTTFNLLCTALLLPMSSLLERLACRIVPETDRRDGGSELDERLFKAPAVALARSRVVTEGMAQTAAGALRRSLRLIDSFDAKAAEAVRADENATDHDEDILGSYLVRLNARPMTGEDNRESARLLHVIGDFERIADHAVNLVESAEELHDKGILLSPAARRELAVLTGAVDEIVDLALSAFLHNDMRTAELVEPLEQVVDDLKEQLRSRHILRLQKGECTIEAGFVWSDLLTNLERVADHCSNVAACVIEMSRNSMDMHEYVDNVRTENPNFGEHYREFAQRYALEPLL